MTSTCTKADVMERYTVTGLQQLAYYSYTVGESYLRKCAITWTDGPMRQKFNSILGTFPRLNVTFFCSVFLTDKLPFLL